MRVAVLGAGYAGVTAARRLERMLPDDVDIVVVDETGTHLVQHQLHRVVREPAFADDITIPLEDILDRTDVRRARVTEVDPESNTIELADEASLEYDYAVVCLGAETNFYDLPGVEEHATPLKRIPHARRIRAEFLGAVEGNGDVFVGGAGLSGIQVAGELAALRDELADIGDASVTLLERFDAVAPTFPANFQRAVREELTDRGVQVRTGAAVECVTDEEILLADGTTVAYDQFVWTGGIRGPRALGGVRPKVDSTLQLDGRMFVVGDAARVVDSHGEAVPASAQAAVREARLVAKNIARLIDHERDGDGVFDPRLEPFAFDSPGWLVSVGDGAVAQVGPTVFRGTAAHALKTTVGVGYLTSIGALRTAAELAREEFRD